MRKTAYLFLALFLLFLFITLSAVGSYVMGKVSRYYHSGVDEFVILILMFLDIIFLIVFLIIYFKK